MPYDPNNPYGYGQPYDPSGGGPVPLPNASFPPPGSNAPSGAGVGSNILGAFGGPAGAISAAAGAGLGILGSAMQGQAANTAANRQWQILQSELARRNAIQAGLMGAAAPGSAGLMTSAGVTDPVIRASILGAASGQSIGEAGAGAQQPTVTPAHLLPGRAHLNANDIVNKVENPFGQAMAQISQGGGSLQDLKNAYKQYLDGIQNFTSSGGANAKVAQQSLNNPNLSQTFSRLWMQLGGGSAPILGQAPQGG